MEKIKFGTDGWRGVIAKDFTFSNVDKVAQAIADYYKAQGGERQGLAMGYDNRFLSSEFVREVAEVLAGNDIPVILSPQSLPTQCISLAVRDRNLAGGIMVTASHNPPQFNGIKIKCPFGGPAPPEVTRGIEDLLGGMVRKISLKKGENKGLIRREDLIEDYLVKVTSFLNGDLIKKADLKIVYDPMFGVGDGLIRRLLATSRCKIVEIHSEYNPGFGGLNPEPIEENLKELRMRVRKEGADLGIATDGDADRVGIVDEGGRYLSPHQIFSLLLLYMIEERGIRGGIAKTVSLGYQPERIAREFGLSLDETPVGFKYICEKMLREDVLFGGEESGGYGYREHLPERDGLFSSLLLIEMITKKERPLSRILKEMESRFGRSFFRRVDFEQAHLINKEEMVSKISSSMPACLGGKRIKETKTIDGVKFIMEDESWLLLRPSGTEPKMRVYAEAPDEEGLTRIIEEGKELMERINV